MVNEMEFQNYNGFYAPVTKTQLFRGLGESLNWAE